MESFKSIFEGLDKDDFSVGDVVKLDWTKLKNPYAIKLAKGGHMFLVTDKTSEGMIRVNTITSSEQIKLRFPYYAFDNIENTPFRKPCVVAFTSTGIVPESYVFEKVGSIDADEMVKVLKAYKEEIDKWNGPKQEIESIKL